MAAAATTLSTTTSTFQGRIAAGRFLLTSLHRSVSVKARQHTLKSANLEDLLAAFGEIERGYKGFAGRDFSGLRGCISQELDRR